MLPHEAVNSSLSTLIFNYNNHFKTFLSPTVQHIYKSFELIDTAIKCSDDFSTLTHNNLLTAFQSHCITLHEAALRFCALTKRSKKEKMGHDLVFFPIRKFINELRCSHAHLEEKFLRPTWDRGKNENKKPFKFTIQIPVSKNSKLGFFYDLTSKTKQKFSFQGTPGRELRLNRNFIHKLILLSFHFRKIFTFRRIYTCDDFLNKYKSKWSHR